MDRISSIVVPTDFSPLSAAAIERAIDLARLNGASIHLIHALRSPVVATSYEVALPVSVLESVREGAEAQLARSREEIEAKGISNVTAEVALSGEVSDAVDDAIHKHDADLVVMGSHGHSGIKRAFLGSVAERVLRSSTKPVMVVREEAAEADEPIEKILVGVDFSKHSQEAVEVATRLARRVGASIDVVHVIDLPPDFVPYASLFGAELEKKMTDTAAVELAAIGRAIEEAQVPFELHTVRGHPAEALARAAESYESDLIVIGTRGASGLAHVLLGSVAERTIRTSPCSVLAVHVEDDDAPNGEA